MKNTVTATLVGALALFGATGCENKIKQCNDFIKVANESQNAFATVATALGDEEKMKKHHDEIDAGIEKVKAVELKDEKLKAFQGRWVEGLEGLNTSLEGFKDLSDPTKITKASEELKKEGDEMSDLINEVNAYCTGGS